MAAYTGKDADGDRDEQPPPYLQDAELHSGGISQPCDYTGRKNQELIDEMLQWGK